MFFIVLCFRTDTNIPLIIEKYKYLVNYLLFFFDRHLNIKYKVQVPRHLFVSRQPRPPAAVHDSPNGGRMYAQLFGQLFLRHPARLQGGSHQVSDFLQGHYHSCSFHFFSYYLVRYVIIAYLAIMIEESIKFLLLTAFCYHLLRWVWAEQQYAPLPADMPPEGYAPEDIFSDVQLAEFFRDVVDGYDEEGREPPQWALAGLNKYAAHLPKKKTAPPVATEDHPAGGMAWAVQYKNETFTTKPTAL